MVTIKVNERTKAGKALIETARVMAMKYRGIDILKDDHELLEEIKKNHQITGCFRDTPLLICEHQ